MISDIKYRAIQATLHIWRDFYYTLSIWGVGWEISHDEAQAMVLYFLTANGYIAHTSASVSIKQPLSICANT